MYERTDFFPNVIVSGCIYMYICMRIPWRRKWEPTPVFLPGEFHGQGAWWAIVHGVAKSQTWLSDQHPWKNRLFPKCCSQWIHTHTHTCMFYVLFSHYLWTSFLFSGNLLSRRVCHLICNGDLSPDERALGMKSSSGLRGRPDTKSCHVLVCLCLFSSLLIRISQKWGLLILLIGFSHGEAPPKYPGNLPCFL